MSLRSFAPDTTTDLILKQLRRRPCGLTMAQLIARLKQCDTHDVTESVSVLLQTGTIAVTNGLFWIRD